jgi:hypothetical protein
VTLCVFGAPMRRGTDRLSREGQSADQQKKDEDRVQPVGDAQTGVDPSKPAADAAARRPNDARQRAARRGAGVHAARRAARSWAGSSAAMPARARPRRRGRRARQKPAAEQRAAAAGHAAAAAAQSSQNARTHKARAACLEGRGYSVK